ncbi:DUF4381 family protein [Luteimonas abyssi]|uniref:DUF4381 family protein n=1 Tax=Luteimonas abyssi TaxID=1247514 RepID=UPI000737AF06|nr:DUF4381 family protein [Luteimonas abyssi]
MSASPLVLRDIHQPAAPAWWPPAPGWWVLAGVLALAIAALVVWRWRARRHRQQLERLFDETLERAGSPAEQVAAISELMRRAARRRDRTATALQAEAWEQFLRAPRVGGTGLGAEAAALVRDGGFRRDLDPVAVEALRREARGVFLAWSLRR